jgi:hypothetical protein
MFLEIPIEMQWSVGSLASVLGGLERKILEWILLKVCD